MIGTLENLHLKYSDYRYYELIAARKVALAQYKSNPNNPEFIIKLTIIALYVQAHCTTCYNRLSVCTRCGESKCTFCKNHECY